MEFTFADYSRLDLEKDGLRKKLKELFDKKPADQEQKKQTDQEKQKDQDRLDAFCREVQAALDQHTPMDLTLFLPAARKGEKEEDPPQLFQSYYNKDGTKAWYTQGYVGVVRLSLQEKDVILRFRSRFDTGGEARFLSYVLEKAFELKSGETKGAVYADMEVEDSVERLLGTLPLLLFFRQLSTALKGGLYRQYQEFSRNDSNVRGRIDVPRHIRENPLQNGRISYVTREYTADNAVNQLIVQAAACLERRNRSAYTRMLRGDERCARGLAALRGELFDRPPVSDRQAIRGAEKKIVHSVYRDYEPLRNTCIAILRHFGTDFMPGKAGKTPGLLLDMPALWEVFLYNTVISKLTNAPGAYRQKDYDYTILEKRRSVRPDYLFRNLEVTLDGGKYKGVVLDAKYKKIWGKAYKRTDWEDNQKNREAGFNASEIREDIFQVIAYMHIFKCKAGGVVFPFSEDPEKFKAQFIKIDAEKEGKESIELSERFALLPYFIHKESGDFEGDMAKSAEKILHALGKYISSEAPSASALP